MSQEIIEHAAALLREDADVAVPVRRLYSELEAALGPQPGGSMRLYERLRRERDRFIVLERHIAGCGEPIEEDEARAFRESLRLAGIETEPRVMLRAQTPANGATCGSFADHDDVRRSDHSRTLGRLRATLAGLVGDVTFGDDLEDELMEALDRATELRRALAELNKAWPPAAQDAAAASNSADHHSSSMSSASRR